MASAKTADEIAEETAASAVRLMGTIEMVNETHYCHDRKTEGAVNPLFTR